MSGPNSLQRRHGETRRRHHPAAYFLLVAVVLASIYLMPLGYTVWLALHDSAYFNVKEFSGLESFGRLFADETLLVHTGNTLAYVLGSLAVALPFGFAAALLLDKVVRFKRFARSLLLLPWLMSQATAGLIWMWFLNPSYGPFPYLLGQLGIANVAVFSNPSLAMGALVLITAWWSYPQAMLFLVGALQMIPGELRESLQVDGGGAWHSFRYITLPHLRNTLVTVAMILIMNYLQMVTIMLVTTRGGPFDATTTISLRIYDQMFTDFQMSDSAASALFLFALNMLLTVIIVRLRRREEA